MILSQKYLNLVILTSANPKIMKKIFITLAMMAAMAVGCQKQEIVDPVEESFVAKIEVFDSETKTSVDSDHHIEWSSGDRLAIFQGSSLADEYIISDNSVGKMNGIFNMVADNNEVNGSFSAGTELPCNVAWYPYSEDLSLIGSAYGRGAFELEGVLLPSVQNYSENSFANGAFPMVAVTKSISDHDLYFKNVLGAMRIQVRGTQVIKSIKIEGANEEKLSGAATVVAYPNNLVPEVKMSSDASTEVTLDCGDGVQLSETDVTNFIIALPPVVFEDGFKVTIVDSDNETYTISATVQNTILRSNILTMSPITLGASGKVTPDAEQDFAVKFKDPIFEEYVVSHFDLDCDGFLSFEEAENVVVLDVSGKKISDFTGIEHLVNLETLDCSNNTMTELDLRANTKLKMLKCDQNSSVDTLMLSGVVDLESLSFTNAGKVRVLDLSSCHKLKYLTFTYCSMLKEVKFGTMSDLREIHMTKAGSTKLDKQLDLSTCGSLRELEVYGLGLKSLNLSSCPNLEILNCSQNDLTELDLTYCQKLSSLNVKLNPLCVLKLGDNPYITSVELTDAVSIKVSGLNVQHIKCGEDSTGHIRINQVDFSECPNLQSAYIKNFYGELNLSDLKHLKEFTVHTGGITNLILDGSENIESITFNYWTGTPGTSFTISSWGSFSLPNLKSLYVLTYGMPRCLDLSRCPSLEHLEIYLRVYDEEEELKEVFLCPGVELDETSSIPTSAVVEYVTVVEDM